MGERVFVGGGHTTASLIAMCAEVTAIQSQALIEPLVGKWIQVAGYIHDVTAGWKETITVSLFEYPDLPDHHVYLAFPNAPESLKGAHKRQLLVCQGEIDTIKNNILMLNECEVIDILPAPPPKPSFAEEVALALDAGDDEVPEARKTEKAPLAMGEMRRFAELYLSIWEGSAVEGKALEAIRATYPENSIGRDAFFKIFREIRGPGKRGNPAFRG